ncbi:unnamed protein product [Schistosoma curassoni]|uniref:Uncharacterized protein n=1 Tax=Schistosoma curassoni TaxID=6186 RepID=A0A183K8X1_9TREM|nr:unnamed protein product [Schistosoma curassoni]
MVVESSQLETLDLGFVLLGTRQQSVPVILRELMLPDGFDLVSPNFTVRDVTRVSCLLPPTIILFQHSAWNVGSPRLVTTLQLGR